MQNFIEMSCNFYSKPKKIYAQLLHDAVIIHMVKRKEEEGNPGEIGFACCNQINYNNMLSFNVPDMLQDIFYPEIFLSK